MKKIILLLIVAISVCSCTSKKEYHKKVREIYGRTVAIAYVCEQSANGITSTWSTAIFDDRDSHGNYCSDFNDAIQTYMADNSELFASLKAESDTLTYKLADIKDAPSDCKEEYEDMLDIVTDVTSFIRLATDPSGSLQSYRDDFHEIDDAISKKIDAFKIKHADVLKEEEE